jgi:hypothetical protein
MAGILDQLLGGGAPAGADVPMTAGSEPPLTIPDPEPQLAAGGGRDEVTVLKDLLGLIQEYRSIPTVEETERLEAAKADTILQKLLADNQKMADGLTGADPAVRKALGPRG